MRYPIEKYKLQKIHQRSLDNQQELDKIDKIIVIDVQVNFKDNIFKYETEWTLISEIPE